MIATARGESPAEHRNETRRGSLKVWASVSLKVELAGDQRIGVFLSLGSRDVEARHFSVRFGVSRKDQELARSLFECGSVCVSEEIRSIDV